MRLIDAFALESRMYHDAFEVDSDMQKWDSGCWIRYKMFENAIKDAPTIEERKKGKWLHDKDDVLLSGYCSRCGWESIIMETDVADMPYCPNCGADMRGGDDE